MLAGRECSAYPACAPEVAAAGGKFLGSMIGGKTGDAIHLGSSVGNVISDFVSREQLNYQRIKCEIIEY